MADHKSRINGTTPQLFQASRRIVAISCLAQKAQTQGWPDLTLAQILQDN